MAEFALAIAGLLPVAAKILSEIRKITEVNDIVRHAKEELEELETKMTRLDGELQDLALVARHNSAIRFPEADHRQIKRVLEQCEEFLSDNYGRDLLLSRGVKATAARLLSSRSRRKVEELREYRRRVYEIYIEIINPFWCRCECSPPDVLRLHLAGKEADTVPGCYQGKLGPLSPTPTRAPSPAFTLKKGIHCNACQLQLSGPAEQDNQWIHSTHTQGGRKHW